MKAYIVNAFVRDHTGGNPSGVVLDADLLDLLHAVRHEAKKNFLFHQGDYMKPPSPSLLRVELNIIGEQMLVDWVD